MAIASEVRALCQHIAQALVVGLQLRWQAARSTQFLLEIGDNLLQFVDGTGRLRSFKDGGETAIGVPFELEECAQPLASGARTHCGGPGIVVIDQGVVMTAGGACEYLSYREVVIQENQALDPAGDM